MTVISGPRSPKPKQRDRRGLEQIERSLLKVRILHYINRGRVSAHDISRQLRQHGCVITSTTLGALLSRMRSLQWIKTASGSPLRQWFLTAKGRLALKAAKEQLRQVAANWPPPASTTLRA